MSQLNRYVKSLLEGTPALRNILLSGEISNFTDHYRTGHLYFSLKDNGGAIRAVMFAQNASRLRFKPADGMQVLVRGRASLYEQTGQYQFYVDEMVPDGLGSLNLAFEKLKEKLQKEGLFDQKKPIPRYPRRIGVITSPTGAAVRDILQILKRRWPLAEIVFCPVLVQGEGAAPQIKAAIEKMNEKNAADVLIVGRGGGSIEDLWAFNEEITARAVAASRIPVISAVGHETDFTICDFVSDLRAPTPSAAAELAVPDQAEEMRRILLLRARLVGNQEKRLRLCRERLQNLTSRPVLRHPEEWIRGRSLQLDSLDRRLRAAIKAECAQKREKLSALMGKLDGMSPLKTLQRGYCVAQDEDKVIKSVSELFAGQSLKLRFSDGSAACRVSELDTEE